MFLMKEVAILDCTLRDGGYLVDKKFGDTNIKGIISGLVSSGIEFVEIGFLQNEGFGVGKTVYKKSKDVERYIYPKKEGVIYAALADYSRYNIDNLDDNDGNGLDAVRECFFKHEKESALEVCKAIKSKGYKVFVQPVDILGYSDKEILDLVEKINEIEPFCISIVDTFGSMYLEDLHRLFELIHHNLNKSCKIGFHSHNNMQMSNALSQYFVKIAAGRREIIIDSTLGGMGRGAGNTPTELIVEYMMKKHKYSYDIDKVLDLLDTYIDNIKMKCTWGYSTEYFVAGSYSAHVNNIAFLTQKHNIRSRDIRYILNTVGPLKRKRYDYDLLNRTYSDMLAQDINDNDEIKRLTYSLVNKSIIVVAPGNSVKKATDEINSIAKENNAIIISINCIIPNIKSDYIFVCNKKRIPILMNNGEYDSISKIITSNVNIVPTNKDYLISYNRLMKCDWNNIDNSTIMLLRLLDIIGVNLVYVAGLDGYSMSELNYVVEEMELSSVSQNAYEINQEIKEMLDIFIKKKHKEMKLKFITKPLLH